MNFDAAAAVPAEPPPPAVRGSTPESPIARVAVIWFLLLTFSRIICSTLVSTTEPPSGTTIIPFTTDYTNWKICLVNVMVSIVGLVVAIWLFATAHADDTSPRGRESGGGRRGADRSHRLLDHIRVVVTTSIPALLIGACDLFAILATGGCMRIRGDAGEMYNSCLDRHRNYLMIILPLSTMIQLPVSTYLLLSFDPTIRTLNRWQALGVLLSYFFFGAVTLFQSVQAVFESPGGIALYSVARIRTTYLSIWYFQNARVATEHVYNALTRHQRPAAPQLHRGITTGGVAAADEGAVRQFWLVHAAICALLFVLSLIISVENKIPIPTTHHHGATPEATNATVTTTTLSRATAGHAQGSHRREASVTLTVDAGHTKPDGDADRDESALLWAARSCRLVVSIACVLSRLWFTALSHVHISPLLVAFFMTCLSFILLCLANVAVAESRERPQRWKGYINAMDETVFALALITLCFNEMRSVAHRLRRSAWAFMLMCFFVYIIEQLVHTFLIEEAERSSKRGGSFSSVEAIASVAQEIFLFEIVAIMGDRFVHAPTTRGQSAAPNIGEESVSAVAEEYRAMKTESILRLCATVLTAAYFLANAVVKQMNQWMVWSDSGCNKTSFGQASTLSAAVVFAAVLVAIVVVWVLRLQRPLIPTFSSVTTAPLLMFTALLLAFSIARLFYTANSHGLGAVSVVVDFAITMTFLVLFGGAERRFDDASGTFHGNRFIPWIRRGTIGAAAVGALTQCFTVANIVAPEYFADDNDACPSPESRTMEAFYEVMFGLLGLVQCLHAAVVFSHRRLNSVEADDNNSTVPNGPQSAANIPALHATTLLSATTVENLNGYDAAADARRAHIESQPPSTPPFTSRWWTVGFVGIPVLSVVVECINREVGGKGYVTDNDDAFSSVHLSLGVSFFAYVAYAFLVCRETGRHRVVKHLATPATWLPVLFGAAYAALDFSTSITTTELSGGTSGRASGRAISGLRLLFSSSLVVVTCLQYGLVLPDKAVGVQRSAPTHTRKCVAAVALALLAMVAIGHASVLCYQVKLDVLTQRSLFRQFGFSAMSMVVMNFLLSALALTHLPDGIEEDIRNQDDDDNDDGRVVAGTPVGNREAGATAAGGAGTPMVTPNESQRLLDSVRPPLSSTIVNKTTLGRGGLSQTRLARDSGQV